MSPAKSTARSSRKVLRRGPSSIKLKLPSWIRNLESSIWRTKVRWVKGLVDWARFKLGLHSHCYKARENSRHLSSMVRTWIRGQCCLPRNNSSWWFYKELSHFCSARLNVFSNRIYRMKRSLTNTRRPTTPRFQSRSRSSVDTLERSKSRFRVYSKMWKEFLTQRWMWEICKRPRWRSVPTSKSTTSCPEPTWSTT